MNGEGEGVPIRFPAIAELEVDSRDRYKSGFFINAINYQNLTTSSDILFPVKQSFLSGYFTRVALSEVNLQWNTPNINNYNNRFRWAYLRTNGNVSVYSGGLNDNFYDAEQLTSAMAKNMSIVQTGGIGQFSSTFYRSFSASTAGGGISWGVGIAPSTLSSFGYVDVSGELVPTGSTIGFAYLPPVDFTFSNNLVSSIVTNPTYLQENKFWVTVNAPLPTPFVQFNSTIYANSNLDILQLVVSPFTPLAYTEYIDIVSDTLCKFSKVKDNMTRQENGQTNVLARLYLTPYTGRFDPTDYFSKPFRIATDYSTPKYIRWLPAEYLNNFDLRLYDQYGELVYWSPTYSTEYQMNIHASET